MNIAVQGCCHGELDTIYKTIEDYEAKNSIKAIRDDQDLEDLSCPPKYKKFRNFKSYYTGDKSAPVLTVFIGGNHEAVDLLKNLYYGGWVAPNIYYLGHSGVVNFRGLRIAGISGIYNFHNYTRGYFEHHPYNEDTKRSAYHIREFDVEKLNLIDGDVDIFLSHDWPAGIENHGNISELLKIKPYFVDDINNNTLGNPKIVKLLEKLKPRYWFSAHLHVKYEADYKHVDGSVTHFLALDKVLPRRHFLETIEVHENDNKYEHQGCCEHADNNSVSRLCYDREWCAILVANRHRMPLNAFPSSNPITLSEPSKEDYEYVDERLWQSGYDTISSCKIKCKESLYCIPMWDELYKDIKSQRVRFMELLEIPDNTYFTPNSSAKFTVVLRD